MFILLILFLLLGYRLKNKEGNPALNEFYLLQDEKFSSG